MRTNKQGQQIGKFGTTLQVIHLRCYPILQMTNKNSEYYAKRILYNMAKKIKYSHKKSSLKNGIDDEKGDYLELTIYKAVKKHQPNMTVWIKM